MKVRDVVVVQGEPGVEGRVVERRCPNCNVVKPLDDFGMRRLKHAGPNGEDVLRNQSWCRPCRAGK
jgi:hypothetical protein